MPDQTKRMLMSVGKNKITCIIDDDEIYLFSVKKVIEVNKLSDTVLEFRNGQDALDFFMECAEKKQELPDVILLDINMPVMNGWEFIEAFREIKPKLPKEIMLYVVSSSVDSQDVAKAKSFNSVNDYLMKPLTVSQLKNIYAAAS